jgi:hypothetical protein
VYLDWEIREDSSVFIIRDEGEGFDVAAHLAKVETQDELSLHGRGIKMANMLGQSLTYNDAGNEVTMTVRHEEGLPRDIPAGLSNQEVVQVQKMTLSFAKGRAAIFSTTYPAVPTVSFTGTSMWGCLRWGISSWGRCPFCLTRNGPPRSGLKLRGS